MGILAYGMVPVRAALGSSSRTLILAVGMAKRGCRVGAAGSHLVNQSGFSRVGIEIPASQESSYGAIGNYQR